MDKRGQKKNTFNRTIVEDIRIINQVMKTISNRIQKNKEMPQKTLNYYSIFLDYCTNLKNDILEKSGFLDGEVTTEEIMNATLLPKHMEDISLIRENNHFYKRVLAEYAKNKIEKILDLLDDELTDLTEEEKDLYLEFDVTDMEISGKTIQKQEERIKRIVKEKVKAEHGKVRIPLMERDRYKTVDEFIDTYITILSASGSKITAKRIPEQIYANIQQLAEKVQVLKNNGIISEEENTYYHGVLFHLGEYYVSVARGDQILVDEGLKGIKIDRDLFIINQFIAEAVHEVYTYPEETSEREKPKIYIKR